MTHPVEISFTATDLSGLAERAGRIAIVVSENGRLPAGLPRPTREVLARALKSRAWQEIKPGKALELAFPAGLRAEALQLVNLPRRADVAQARAAGASIGARLGVADTLVLAGDHAQAAELALGLALRAYDFSAYKTRKSDADAAAEAPDQPAAATARSGLAENARLDDAAAPAPDMAADQADNPVSGAPRGRVTVMHKDPEALARAATLGAAVAEGVFFTRDLVNEPANVLTTTDFADRLLAMRELGLEVEVLDEDALSGLGMRALLGVGQGSESPSKVVVMRWNGAGDQAPLALVGKGVVFDTGGISIKPAAGMEEMTMDMGGAAVVAGVMRVLALRRARANVVGLVGLVENMPDGRAQRPGDIVRSMKGDTIEVINTDAEGRLVLADVLWYAQERFQPAAVIDLATLTGAVIIALGHEHAGVFSNDEELATQLLAAARAEGEGAWRLPLAPAYDKLIDSRLADVKNTGGRPAGAITAAQFLQRFVRKDTPWLHLDIAGVTLPPGETALAPKGASGWGVMTLNRLIRDRFETRG
ncbi:MULTISPECIES: leucyl aminopeptidase [unclassified Paracoccus (in: a-proteobacteria)]|uniref:leucyl aminopeptidase n=1 Tax=unclassified Paracoccus (in: a-proteobacteria) TaxID=2688777 RepID=UPI0021E19A8D|nr:MULTISPECIES: leucyl aminopeptidase [unclassified Paracoccus (in: a-proteobacteria)]UXU73752.1 leucyl aminopeptidase [Paracoccus sp. SMMA_5]UXU79642.1 leucyl aminopeptidase [Paracoccus sp. SMMA_5_TC]